MLTGRVEVISPPLQRSARPPEVGSRVLFVVAAYNAPWNYRNILHTWKRPSMFCFQSSIAYKKERIFQNDSSRVVNLLQGSLAFFFLPLVYI